MSSSEAAIIGRPLSREPDDARPSQRLLPLPELAPRLASRPFIKWAGGKARLLPRLLPHVPPRFKNYHEPFVGGGAIFFAIRERANGRCYLSDLNDELMNAWTVMRDRANELESVLRRYKAQDSKEFFYSLRSAQPVKPVERAGRFFYLNQTAWNGLWRVNKWGEFNVPWGQRPFRGFTTRQIETFEHALHDVSLGMRDFRAALDDAKRGDFVYLDPPYLPLSDTSKFHLYTEKRFREPDLRELASICKQLTKRGVSWLLSNRDTRLVRELFSPFTIIGLTTRRSVAAQNKRDVEAVNSPEVIVLGEIRK